jgi:hypothetical protein
MTYRWKIGLILGILATAVPALSSFIHISEAPTKEAITRVDKKIITNEILEIIAEYSKKGKEL